MVVYTFMFSFSSKWFYKRIKKGSETQLIWKWFFFKQENSYEKIREFNINKNRWRYVFTSKQTHELCKININAENWQNDIKQKSFIKSKKNVYKNTVKNQIKEEKSNNVLLEYQWCVQNTHNWCILKWLYHIVSLLYKFMDEKCFSHTLLLKLHAQTHLRILKQHKRIYQI